MMEGGDELIILGSFGDFSVGKRYDLEGASQVDVASILVSIHDEIEPYAYKFAGVDYDSISKYASPENDGISGVLDFLSKTPQSKIKKFLLSSCRMKELLPAAESCFFNRLLTKAGLRITPDVEKSISPEKEEVSGQLIFIAKYQKWMAIKKLSLDKAEEWEVGALLSGVNHTIVHKSFDFLDVALDPRAPKLSQGRKSMKNAISALEAIREDSPKADELALLLNNVLTQIGYPPYATLTVLEKAYDVKPPKPKGRLPKG
jgi:hypothetical protein